MEKQTQTIRNDLGNLANDANALVTDTAAVAGNKIQEARKHLSGAVQNARQMASNVSDRATDYAKATNKAVHDYPYQAIGIAFGVGVVFGWLLSSRRSRSSTCESDY